MPPVGRTCSSTNTRSSSPPTTLRRRWRSAFAWTALARIWSALSCPTGGDVLLSAAPGYEFVDWGGADHVGGGSHGSLHATDSLGALMWCGTGPVSRAEREQWSLRDVATIVRHHFGASD